MVTDSTIAAALQPLTPKDREMLAWYLGNHLEAKFLTREDLEPRNLEAWAKAPHIAAQIAAFHYINSIASRSIDTVNYIKAQLAVGDDLRAARTSSERLRAVNAYIRLSSHRRAAGQCATGSPRLGEATSATRSTPAPNSDRDRSLALPSLPPLPTLSHRHPPAPRDTPAHAAMTAPQTLPLPDAPSPHTAASPAAPAPSPVPLEPCQPDGTALSAHGTQHSALPQYDPSPTDHSDAAASSSDHPSAKPRAHSTDTAFDDRLPTAPTVAASIHDPSPARRGHPANVSIDTPSPSRHRALTSAGIDQATPNAGIDQALDAGADQALNAGIDQALDGIDQPNDPRHPHAQRPLETSGAGTGAWP